MDFDGVITDAKAVDLARVDNEWFFWPDRSVSYFERRLGSRQLAALLVHFGELLITTARPSSHEGSIRQWLQRFAPELANIRIVFAGSNKRDALLREGVALHVDDDFLTASDEPPTVLIWSHESPSAFLHRVLTCLEKIFERRHVPGEPLSLRPLSPFSQTPTVLIERATSAAKLRLFQTQDDVENVLSFCAAAETVASGKVVLPKTLDSGALWITTEYQNGTMATEVQESVRTSAIPDLARFLSQLHSLPVRSEDIKRWPSTALRNDQVCYVSCAVDAFNICFTESDTIALIDVCDCIVGSRWVDVLWTEQLYCATREEQDLFVRAYLQESAQQPSAAELSEAARECYSWLHYVIARCGNWTRYDPGAIQERRRIVELRAAPRHSALEAWARQ